MLQAVSKSSTLGVVAPFIRKLSDLSFSLCTFGGDIDSQIFREIESRADDLRPFDREAEAGDERPVDLECINRKTVQIAER